MRRLATVLVFQSTLKVSFLGKFFKGSASAAAAGVLSRGLGLLTLPVLVRFLDKAEYGAYDYLLTLSMLLAVLVSLESGQAITRYAGINADIHARNEVASSVLWFLFFALSLFTALAVYFSPFLALQIFGDESFSVVALPFSLFLSASAFNSYASRVLRAEHLFGWAALYATATALVTSLALVVGVIFYSFGLSEILYASAVSSLIFFFVFLARYSPRIILCFKVSALKKSLAFSIPLVFSSSAIIASLFSDRFVVAEFLGMEAVAEYAVAARLAFLVSIVTTAFQVTVNPLVFSYSEHGREMTSLQQIFLGYLFISLASWGIFWALSDPLISIVAGAEYHSASAVVPLLALSVMVQSAYIFYPGLLVRSRTGIFAAVNVAAAMLNILLNIVLVPRIGVYGAALATLISSVACFAVIGAYSIYVVRFPGSARLFWLYVAMALVAIMAGVGSSAMDYFI